MAVEARFCRRLASPQNIDLFVKLALGAAPKGKKEPRATAASANDPKGSGSVPEGSRADCGNGDGDGDGGGSSGGGGGGGGGGEAQAATPTPKTRMKTRLSGGKVKVASPYVGTLRYCVVAIVERLGSILDDGGELERTASPAEMTSIVVRVR